MRRTTGESALGIVRLILLGFAGAFGARNSFGWIWRTARFAKDGLTITLRRSKTDQEGAGRKIGIPYGSNPETCPVRVLRLGWKRRASVAVRCSVPSSPRAGAAGRLSGRRGTHREEAGATGGPGFGQVCRALATSGPCYERGNSRSFGAVDHEPDRASLRSDGEALYQGREPVPGEQRGEAGVVSGRNVNASNKMAYQPI